MSFATAGSTALTLAAPAGLGGSQFQKVQVPPRLQLADWRICRTAPQIALDAAIAAGGRLVSLTHIFLAPAVGDVADRRNRRRWRLGFENPRRFGTSEPSELGDTRVLSGGRTDDLEREAQIAEGIKFHSLSFSVCTVHQLSFAYRAYSIANGSGFIYAYKHVI